MKRSRLPCSQRPRISSVTPAGGQVAAQRDRRRRCRGSRCRPRPPGRGWRPRSARRTAVRRSSCPGTAARPGGRSGQVAYVPHSHAIPWPAGVSEAAGLAAAAAWPDNRGMPAATEYPPPTSRVALRAQCTLFLTGHGPVRPADLLASIPADTVPDRYGDGGVVAELEAEVAGLLGKPAAVFLPSGTMAQQACCGCTPTAGSAGRSSSTRCATWTSTRARRYERLHGLTGRPAGDADRLLTLADLNAIAEPPAALLIELPQRDLGGQQPDWDDLRAQVAGRASAGPPRTWTARGCGSQRPGTAGRRPRSRRCSTPSTSRSTRASAGWPAAAWPGPRTSWPRCGSGASGWAAPCSGCGRSPRRR